MAITSIRRITDSSRAGPNNPLRRWLAIALVVFSIGSAVWIFNRDVDWEVRRREARNQGLTAFNNGNMEEARRQFEMALINQPYDWETHFSLANVLNNHLGDSEGALRHFLYALAYAPDISELPNIEAKIAVLRMIHSGELENPLDALEDMFMAVEANSPNVFRRRLSPKLRDDFTAYWEAWRRRGRGMVTYYHVDSEHNGFYDAVLEMDFGDDTTMSMHFYCPVRDIWRLELSFP